MHDHTHTHTNLSGGCRASCIATTSSAVPPGAVTRSHKIALEPTRKQAAYLGRIVGASRYTYNWSLSKWSVMYETRKTYIELGGAEATAPEKPSSALLSREFTQAKKRKAWLGELPAACLFPAVRQLGDAYDKWWQARKRGDTQHGSPVRKRRQAAGSFTLSNQGVKIDRDAWTVTLPKMAPIKMRELPRWPGKIGVCTVSTDGRRWYLSISIDAPAPRVPSNRETAPLGVDLGIKTQVVAATETGEPISFAAPKALPRALGQLRRAGRTLARRVKGGKNWRKARARLARIHAKVAAIRGDALHKATHAITTTHEHLCIEDLHVKGMLSNGKLARSIADASFGELRRQIEYKTKLRNGTVTIAPRFFASSKLCCACGAKNDDLKLRHREWTCTVCGVRHDRDLNAARNLAAYAANRRAVSPSEPSEQSGGTAGEQARETRAPAANQQAGSPRGHRTSTSRKRRSLGPSMASATRERQGGETAAKGARETQHTAMQGDALLACWPNRNSHR